MTIHLNAEQEQAIAQAIEAGLIRDAGEVVEVGLETIKLRLQARLSSQREMDVEKWVTAFENWANSHSRSTPLLSDEAISRESIYGTRGL